MYKTDAYELVDSVVVSVLNVRKFKNDANINLVIVMNNNTWKKFFRTFLSIFLKNVLFSKNIANSANPAGIKQQYVSIIKISLVRGKNALESYPIFSKLYPEERWLKVYPASSIVRFNCHSPKARPSKLAYLNIVKNLSKTDGI